MEPQCACHAVIDTIPRIAKRFIYMNRNNLLSPFETELRASRWVAASAAVSFGVFAVVPRDFRGSNQRAIIRAA
jgi:hypothetical protein